MSNRPVMKVLVLSCIVSLALVLAVGIPWFIRARTESAHESCICKLRQLDGIEQQWALDHQKTSNAVPTWDDIRDYLPNGDRERGILPKCPEGGAYTLSRVADKPTCSIGRPGHALPD